MRGSHFNVTVLSLRFQVARYIKLVGRELASFSSLLTARDVLQGGKSATQGQQFHIDDVNRCLHRVVKMHRRYCWLL